jgi:hypothetical protein
MARDARRFPAPAARPRPAVRGTRAHQPLRRAHVIAGAPGKIGVGTTIHAHRVSSISSSLWSTSTSTSTLRSRSGSTRAQRGVIARGASRSAVGGRERAPERPPAALVAGVATARSGDFGGPGRARLGAARCRVAHLPRDHLRERVRARRGCLLRPGRRSIRDRFTRPISAGDTISATSATSCGANVAGSNGWLRKPLHTLALACTSHSPRNPPRSREITRAAVCGTAT